MKTLSNRADYQSLCLRVATLAPTDKAHWGSMSVHQMVCHLNDAYKCPLREKFASPANSLLQRTVIKWCALHLPTPWPKGVATRPEIEQGKGGSRPTDFEQDVAAVLSIMRRFCTDLPTPFVQHPMFGKMSKADWMRWGYLHTDHHLRQFGR